MLLIMTTGNYCYFNLLAIALSVLLFDDAVWLPLVQKLIPDFQLPAQIILSHGWPLWVTIPVAVIIAVLSVEVVCRLFRCQARWPGPVERLIECIEPFRLVNSYGLFSVMTAERPEIMVEGSNDGNHWVAYEFKWKPGEAKHRPRFVAPHQPRLDWQMWFAALDDPKRLPWFWSFLERLLENEPTVTALLEKNPFADKPPTYVRAQFYDYIFADTWHGKYLVLHEVIEMLNRGGLYIIDDMLPQPNWPDDHAPKVQQLLEVLDQHPQLSVTKLSWASGIVIAARRAT
jgi:hypothetical protein